MQSKTYDKLQQTMKAEGPAATFERLLAELHEQKDYHRLFDALTMKARYELGIPLVHANSAELPKEQRQPYEDKIIAACRQVGDLLLKSDNIAHAYHYFNMIGEPEPIRLAIENYAPGEEGLAEGVVEIAIGQGVHPEKGLALLLKNNGICQSITACEGIIHQAYKPEIRHACIKQLVRALYTELLGRLSAEIAHREQKPPAAGSISLLIANRDWLFTDENYHIDTSHLNSVVRMARMLPKCEELFLAIQLCEYGRRLSERYRYAEPPPFENVFDDTLAFLKIVAGIEVDKGLEHFRKKAEAADPDETGTFPAEVYVSLLSGAGRDEEAIAFAGKALNTQQAMGSLTSTINELCQDAGRFDAMAQLARQRDDLLSYVAGIVQDGK